MCLFCIIRPSLVQPDVPEEIPKVWLAKVPFVVADLPGLIWSRMNVRLDRNQGGHGHAQDTGHTRRGHPPSADGGTRHRQRLGGTRCLPEARHYRADVRAQFFNGELFYTLKEAQIMTERLRSHYNTVRPHSSLGGPATRPRNDPACERGLTKKVVQQLQAAHSRKHRS